MKIFAIYLTINDEAHRFNPNETGLLIKAIGNVKILDPACGSGAFPMGVLHRLVFAHHKLDPQNKLWKNKQIERVEKIEVQSAREAAIENIEQAFENNALDFARKLFLIQNCIFGVDIQPVAVQKDKLNEKRTAPCWHSNKKFQGYSGQ